MQGLCENEKASSGEVHSIHACIIDKKYTVSRGKKNYGFS